MEDDPEKHKELLKVYLSSTYTFNTIPSYLYMCVIVVSVNIFE